MSESPPAAVGNIPLVVLTQGNPYDPERSPKMTEAQFTEFRAVWTVLQEELKSLSPKGVRLTATESGHRIPLEQPRLVIDAIEGVVKSLRAPMPDPDTVAQSSKKVRPL